MSSIVSGEAIRFYCGLGEKHYNHHPVVTGPYACVAPVSGSTVKKINSVAVPKGVAVLQDSGAFNDACLLLRGQERHISQMKHCRVSFKEALQRQERHAEHFGYSHQIEARASYDVLIDETWTEDASGLLVRCKKRWSETDAAIAVEETIAAAAYLHQHRNGLPCILSAQGVSPRQYLHCVEQIMPSIREGDIVGLGGFCILGLDHSYLPGFRETMRLVIPFLKREGIRRVHLWGVCFAEPLGELLWLCDHDEVGNPDPHQRISLSTDSIGPSTRPVKKNPAGCGTWGYASWCNNRYPIPPVLDSCKIKDADGNKIPICAPDTRCRGLERGRHVLQTVDWFAHFRSREPRLYRAPCYQSSWLEVAS
jgi:hypothetical protein